MTMLRYAILISALLAVAPAAAQQSRVIGKETSIPFAANGGIRDWEHGPRDSNVLYLQDRALRWYRVELTGPCVDLFYGGALIYKTDTLGNFDRFSTIQSAQDPMVRCGVRSVTNSETPEARKSRKKD